MDDDGEWIQVNGEWIRMQRFARFPVTTMLYKQFLLRDIDFHKDFRCSRPQFEKIMQIVGPHLPLGLSSNGVSVKPRERVLHFFYFLGANSLYRENKVAI